MRWHPVAYSTDGDRYIIVASRGGAPTSPDWYHNLVANPSAVIEVGSDVIAVEATIASGAEREGLYAQHAARMPAFNDYKTKTTREIPVVVLTRKS
jgi:deazaflavin-dependent oxidoreductase (nitroreductase family)